MGSPLRRLALVAALASGLHGVAAAAEAQCTDGAPLAGSLRLDYAVTASRSVLTLNGDGTITYRRQGDTYELASTLQAFGIFEASQQSRGMVSSGGLVPQAYVQRTGRRTPRTATLNWTAGKVSFSAAKERYPTQPQMQDRLSLLLQLAWRLQREPAARLIVLPVAGVKHTSTYRFEAVAAETITVAAGRFDTMKFERHKDEDDDDALEVWLAPALCGVPVKLRFADDKGTVIEQKLRAVELL